VLLPQNTYKLMSGPSTLVEQSPAGWLAVEGLVGGLEVGVGYSGRARQRRVLAAKPRPCPPEGHRRADPSGRGVRRGCRSLRRRPRRGRRRAGDRERGRAARSGATRRFCHHRARSGRYGGVRGPGPGRGGEDPVHLGFDRGPEGRAQYPSDAVCQPADDAAGLAVPHPRAAGDRRLAALERYFRRQPQHEHDAHLRRHDLCGRGPSGAGNVRADDREPHRRAADHLLQRPGRLCGARAGAGVRSGLRGAVLLPATADIQRRGGAARGPAQPARRTCRA
jgi:hypothetical protein